jgi:hypothetical protein
MSNIQTSAYLDRPCRTLAQLAEELGQKVVTTLLDSDAWRYVEMRQKVLAKIAARRKP